MYKLSQFYHAYCYAIRTENLHPKKVDVKKVGVNVRDTVRTFVPLVPTLDLSYLTSKLVIPPPFIALAASA